MYDKTIRKGDNKMSIAYEEIDFEMEENTNIEFTDSEFKNLYFVEEVDFGKAIFLKNGTEKIIIEANFTDLMLQDLIEKGAMYDDKTVDFLIKEATKDTEEKYENFIKELKEQTKN